MLRSMIAMLMLVSTIAAGAASRDDERRVAWTGLATIGADANWFNESDMFAARSRARPALAFPGLPIGATARGADRLAHIGDAPIITFVHYNRAAYGHIRRQRLYSAATLRALVRRGVRQIPPFPKAATVMMTGWWPVAAHEATPLPVWDSPPPGDPVPRDYVSWPRIVVVSADSHATAPKRIAFAGRDFADPRGVEISRFRHVRVDAAMARRLMADTGARKAALIALERPLIAGDQLVLVAMHLLSYARPGGQWSTFWWHDQPDRGRFAQDRPAGLPAPWHNYLMDQTSDAARPAEPDGSPRICFNPWFEARFPDGGNGGGHVSNCVACHARASFPRTDFLPIRRGVPDQARDPAFAPGRLRTGGLWSLGNPGAAAPQSIR